MKRSKFIFSVFLLLSITLFAENNSNKKLSAEENLEKWKTTLQEDLKKSTSDSNMTLAVDNNAVGYFYNKTGNPKKALEHYLKAVEIVNKHKNHYNQKRTIYYNNVGSAYEKLNKLQEALEYYKKALAIYQDKLDANHPYIAGNSFTIGNIYEKMGKNEIALNYHLSALKIRRKSLRPLNHPDTMVSYDKVLELLEKKKDYENLLLYGKQFNSLLFSVDENKSKILEEKLKVIKKKIEIEKKVTK